MPLFAPPFPTSNLNLNPAGVAGFFGGESAISAMETLHLYKGAPWLGWYNSPGSYTLAKHFGRIGKLRFLDPRPNMSTAKHHGEKGPTFFRPWSGTTTGAGDLAHLTMEMGRRVPEQGISGRETTPVSVVYLTMKPVDYGAPFRGLPLIYSSLGLIPVAISLTACFLCSAVGDLFCALMIALGIIFNGSATWLIGRGSGRLVIKSQIPDSAPGLPRHGILVGDREVVVIKGGEEDVETVTQGRFEFKPDSRWGSNGANIRDYYYAMRACAFLFLIQFILQLSLVPQGSLFGQTMFLVSLGVSWIYNTYLSSSKEDIESDTLSQMLGDSHMLRYRAGTRTTMAVFASLLLFHGIERSSRQEEKVLRAKTLHSFLPNESPVWRRWKDKVVEQLLDVDDKSESLSHLEEDVEDWALSSAETSLLRILLDDARTAFRAYFRVRERLSGDSFVEKLLAKHPDGPCPGFIYFKLEEM